MSDFIIPEDYLREQALADGITHLSTGVAVIKDGKILVVRREPGDFLGGSYELPGGGIDPGETFAESVAREVLEETGLRVSKILGMFPGFEYTTPVKPKVRQMNFLVATTNDEVMLSGEHDQFRWIGPTEIDSLETTGPMADCLKAAFAAGK
ncbi:MAG: NUDIX domain-containing protein [Candidatus Saccharimonadales bacterium]